jgi:hypothetical protein
MDVEKVTQTQDQQQEQQQEEMIAKTEYDKVLAELEEVKAKLPKEPTDEEKALEAKQQELWQKEISLSLKEAGLEKFADIVKVNDEKELKDVIKKLTAIVNEIKIQNGYIPADHAKTDEYSKYEKEKNVAGMIAVKLSKLFQ